MIIISLVLALFFTLASSIKLVGWQKFVFDTQLSFFKRYGLSRFHMFAVGLIEFSAALLLFLSVFLSVEMINVLGALMIALTSIGAIFFHLKFDTFKDAIAAIITLSLSLTLLIFNHQVLASYFS